MALRKSIVNRFAIVYVVIFLAFILAGWRMLYIVTIEQEKWLAGVKELQQSEVKEVKPERGSIYAADGSLITTTIPYYNLYVDFGVGFLSQREGKDYYEKNIDSLCICLSNKFNDKSASEYRKMFDEAYAKKKRRVRFYPRRVSYLDMVELKSFPYFRAGQNRSGFFVEEYFNRENLYGSLAGRTIGNVYGADGRGQYGLELMYDSLLAGEVGTEKGHLVGRGKWVYVEEKPSKRGADIFTTIDIEMQDICDYVLREKVKEVEAQNACLILMEVKTGEIKSMVNLQRAGDGSYFEGWNMAVADLSEPGSTFKTMSLMVALDHNVCDTADKVFLNHGTWTFHSRVMTDHNWRRGGYDTLSVAGILAQSSNVGVSRIIDENYRKDPMKYINAMLDTKFFEQLDFGIPGTAKPTLPTPENKERWSGVTLPWMSIGYEVQVPPIYTLNFYNAIANGGKMMRPYLVREIQQEGRVIVENSPEIINSSICKESTLKKLQGMLLGVVENGTAKSLKSKYFGIAGKTGTAQLEYKNGKAGGYQYTFCGYFPADNPIYSCIVVVKKPAKQTSAGASCGDVFKVVAEKIYALQIEQNLLDLVEWEKNSDKSYNLPNVKSGARENVEMAMDLLDLSYEANESDWISLSTLNNSDKLQVEERVVLEDVVPDVRGMGAIDAVYLLENCGLNVELKGAGRVVKQSIQSGKNVVRGSKIELILR